MGGRIGTSWPVLILLGLGLAACAEGGSTGSEPRAGTGDVVEVIDGDTVVVAFEGREESIRLIGIDTPETHHPQRPVECFGPEATDFTRDLLPAGTPVRVDRDIEHRDDYGRLLGYVYRDADGVFVNYELVRHGYAVPLRFEPNTTHAATFVDAARSAEREDAGLWAACGG